MRVKRSVVTLVMPCKEPEVSISPKGPGEGGPEQLNRTLGAFLAGPRGEPILKFTFSVLALEYAPASDHVEC